MAPKPTAKEKTTTVKGDEAEEMVLQYMKSVNRPYASTDVSANLKNKVTKTNAQKVLQLLADKGSLTLKTYGKQTIFVYNQDRLPTLPEGSLAELDNELKELRGAVEAARKTLKNLTLDLNKRLAEPKTEELETEIAKIEAQNAINLKHLVPLRLASGAGSQGETSDGVVGPIKQEELNALDSEWVKWRKEWVSRKKVYQALLDMVQPDLSPSARPAFEEEVGVDEDTPEAKAIEAGDLCRPYKPRLTMIGKAPGTSGSTSKQVSGRGIGDTAVKASTAGLKRKRDATSS